MAFSYRKFTLAQRLVRSKQKFVSLYSLAIILDSDWPALDGSSALSISFSRRLRG